MIGIEINWQVVTLAVSVAGGAGGIVGGLLRWSLARNITAQDAKITQLDQKIEKLCEKLDASQTKADCTACRKECQDRQTEYQRQSLEYQRRQDDKLDRIVDTLAAMRICRTGD